MYVQEAPHEAPPLLTKPITATALVRPPASLLGYPHVRRYIRSTHVTQKTVGQTHTQDLLQ